MDTRNIIFRIGCAAMPLSSNEIISYMGVDKKALSNFLKRASRKGYVKRVGRRYIVTDKGLSLIKRKLYKKIHKIIYGINVKPFRFFKAKGEFTGVKVKSLKELVEALKLISLDSLKFHFEKYDVQRWLRDELGDDFLVYLINSHIKHHVNAFDLRNALYDLLSSRLDKLLALEKKLIELK